MTGYRRDIDGLRAIAVMGVILTHAGFAFPRAGFAGVDIFFVISGFLIGGAIADESRSGRFSFAGFYARRGRRILPALLFMLLATLPLSWLLMTPEQLRYFGGGALASVFFLANIWFFNRIDYFNPEAAADPLVHLWSLGIEEQFYLVIPLLMVATVRFRPGWIVPIVAGLLCLSFALALSVTPERPMAGFYLPYARAWELLVGVLAALVARRVQQFSGPRWSHAGSLLGLVSVLGGLIFIPSEALWPSAYTLVPVVGSMLLVVFTAHGQLSERLLGWQPFVWVGLVSYSAYLWHQPIFGFLQISGTPLQSGIQRAVAVVVCLAVAWLSWRFVEQPFRKREISRFKTHCALAASTGCVVLFAIGGHVSDGYPFRMPPDVLSVLKYRTSWPETYRRCISGRDEGERLDPAKACIHGADRPAQVAIWGDSHAAVLAKPLGDALGEHGYSVRELTVGSCIPVVGLKNSALKRTEYCAVHNQKMLDYLVEARDIDVVVLNAFWNSYTERRDFDTRAGWVQSDQVIALPLDATISISDSERLSFMASHLRDEVGALLVAGKEVVLLYPLPEAGFDPPEEMARRIWRGERQWRTMGYPTAAFEDYSLLSRAMLDGAGVDSRIHRLDVSGAFCEAEGTCKVVQAGIPLFFNENHLSLAGTAKVVPELSGLIVEILQDKDLHDQDK